MSLSLSLASVRISQSKWNGNACEFTLIVAVVAAKEDENNKKIDSNSNISSNPYTNLGIFVFFFSSLAKRIEQRTTFRASILVLSDRFQSNAVYGNRLEISQWVFIIRRNNQMKMLKKDKEYLRWNATLDTASTHCKQFFYLFTTTPPNSSRVRFENAKRTNRSEKRIIISQSNAHKHLF